MVGDFLKNAVPKQCVPESFVFPPELRPNIVPKYKDIPVIDLGQLDTDRKLLVEEIFKASQEFGFFQVTNHGVDETIVKAMMNEAKGFFDLPLEDKMLLYANDRTQRVRYHSSVNSHNEETHFWREGLTHPVHPVQDFKHLWPSKPTNYKHVTETYSEAARSLSLTLLELLSEGLGLGSEYFMDKIGEDELSINHYPLCPEPGLTMGLPKHVDPNFITLLLQDVSGLQVLNDGEWITVKPLPNAFIVNLGYQLQVISNGKLEGVSHQVVANSSSARTTVAFFIHPPWDCTIEPADKLVDEFDPLKFKAFKYKEFFDAYCGLIAKDEGVLKVFGL